MRNWPAAVVVVSTISGLALPVAASGQTAPTELRGKSVTATWTENRMQRVGDEEDFRSRSVPQTLNVYISTEGRTFTKRTVARGNGRGSDSSSSVGINAGGVQVSQLRGHTLIVTTKFEGGARVARIDFDQSFSSCTATVTISGTNGVVRGHTLGGSHKPLEIKDTTVSGTGCSIQNGNVFAQ